jgi:Membrane protein involved in the export of O-antigen and teichoic acid
LETSLKQRTISGSFWSFADNILGQGITFVVGLALARLLTPNDYGIIGIVIIFVAISNSIVDSGFSNALIRKNNAKDIDYNTVFITNVIVSVIIFVLIFFTAPYISQFFPKYDASVLTPILQVTGVIIIINSFSLIQKTILTKRIDFKTQTKISLISSIISGVVGLTMAFLNFGVWSLSGQIISRQLLYCLLLWIFNSWRPKFSFSKSSFSELFGFGWKLLVSGLIDTIWKEIYSVVIGRYYSGAILGQFTKAKEFSTIFSSNLTSVVQRVSYPALSEIKDDNFKLKLAYKKVIKITMFVTFCCMLG